MDLVDDWQELSQFLLRNRNIREMVDEILKSIPFDEEQHRDHMPSVKKLMNRKNTFTENRKLTVEQTCQLLELYQVTKFPGKKTREKLARDLKLSEIVVKNWFYHRRARETRHLAKNNATPTITEVKQSIHSNTSPKDLVFCNQELTFPTFSRHNTETALFTRQEILNGNENNGSPSFMYSSHSDVHERINDISYKQTSNTSQTVNDATNLLYDAERNCERILFPALPFRDPNIEHRIPWLTNFS